MTEACRIQMAMKIHWRAAADTVFKELDFMIKGNKAIMASPLYDRKDAFENSGN